MKKVLLLAVVLLISGLSFAQSPIHPFATYKEDGYSVTQGVNFFIKNKNAVQGEALKETFLNIPAIKKYFPNLSVNDAIYLLSCSIKRMGHFEKGEYIINGIQDGKVVVCPERGSLADRVKGIAGDEPWILFDVAGVLKDSFNNIIIPPTPPVPVVLARCLNTLTLNVVDVPKKPTPEMPVVERVQNQQMSSDTNIINVNIELPANFSSNNNVVQEDVVSTVAYNNQGYNNNGYVNNSNHNDPNYCGTPVRNLNAFMTANANVDKQCGSYDGSMWGNDYGYSNNQNYNYNNASFSNTASYGNASAGAYFNITGTATTVPVVYNPNVNYYGNSFGGQRQNNNNGGRVVQQRRGANQMQNGEKQNQPSRLAETKTAKPWDGNMW